MFAACSSLSMFSLRQDISSSEKVSARAMRGMTLVSSEMRRRYSISTGFISVAGKHEFSPVMAGTHCSKLHITPSRLEVHRFRSAN